MTNTNSRMVLMGVAGCGKSSVGAALAQEMGASYIDGDDLHPASNVEKMTNGTPLTDDDRWPWLALVGESLGAAARPTIIGCSALKRSYRDAITAAAKTPVQFIHLAGSRQVIESRMSARPSHFMPVSLLDSQFSTLEPLAHDEIGIEVDIDKPFDAVVAEICADLTKKGSDVSA